MTAYVDKLRNTIAELRGELDKALEFAERMRTEREALRTQLAERDSFIHDLEANCDPAGTVRENTLLRDQTKQLDAMIGRLKSELDDMRKVLTDIRESCELSHLRDAQIDAVLSASAEPSAPVDERKAFEAHCESMGLFTDKLPSGAYLIPATRFAWVGWWVRAEYKPGVCQHDWGADGQCLFVCAKCGAETDDPK